MTVNVVKRSATAKKKLSSIVKAEFAGNLRLVAVIEDFLNRRAEQIGGLLRDIDAGSSCYKDGGTDICATCDCGRYKR